MAWFNFLSSDRFARHLLTRSLVCSFLLASLSSSGVEEVGSSTVGGGEVGSSTVGGGEVGSATADDDLGCGTRVGGDADGAVELQHQIYN